ncbi:MAG: glycosyltransferase, partial [Pedobacter sp.]
MTRVSVVMASYNHAQFIEQAINSILTQTMSDLELIVVDDGSVDASNDIVASIKDKRIRHIPLKTNGGACRAMNIAIDVAQSEFVAICNSDDIWEPKKLELQMNLIQGTQGIGAVFSDVTWIDESGLSIKEGRGGELGQFRQENKSRHAWLRQILEDGNCLCHPSVLLRKEVYDRIGNLDNMLRQLPDLDLWIRLLQHYDIHIMQERLVKFRIHPNNTSKLSPAKMNRLHREHMLITKKFFDSVSPANFYRAFYPNSADKADTIDAVSFLRDKVRYLLSAKWGASNVLRELAIETAYFGSFRGDIEVVPALEFHDLTATS